MGQKEAKEEGGWNKFGKQSSALSLITGRLKTEDEPNKLTQSLSERIFSAGKIGELTCDTIGKSYNTVLATFVQNYMQL